MRYRINSSLMCVCVFWGGGGGSIPAECINFTDVFLVLLYLWVVTYSQMCMYEYVCGVGGGGEREKKGIIMK